MRCAMTGQEIKDTGDGIWDDGEWVSWDWINQQIDLQNRKTQGNTADPALADIFDRLVKVATDHKKLTGNYLQIWGVLGELYAEITFGVRRHRPRAQGSDGKIGDQFVEVKTISPEKSTAKVLVKRSGNFSKLLVVKINRNFEFDAKMLDRSALCKGPGKRAEVSWQSIPTPPKVNAPKPNTRPPQNRALPPRQKPLPTAKPQSRSELIIPATRYTRKGVPSVRRL